MSAILFFHHVLGLTPGLLALADELRRAGHQVHTPDLFDGALFDTVEAGLAHADQVGFAKLIDAGVRAADELPSELVYLGYSLGVMPAQKLAQTRPGAAGAVFLESCAPLDYFADGWPAGVPVQVHGMDADPSFVGEGDIDAAREVVAAADDGELFLYPGDGHLFADPSASSYDADAAGLLTQRLLAFLDRVGHSLR